MEYKYADNDNYEDFASGKVLYHTGGMTNFPVRLVNEIYGRCLQYSNKKEAITLYDCCCGGGYSLTVLGFLNQQTISNIIASDIDEKVLEIAKKNLSLLSPNGMNRRMEELHSLYMQFHKESHQEAEESARKLASLIQKDISIRVFQGNAFGDLPLDLNPDIIITDVPYGVMVDWQEGTDTDNVSCLLEALRKICCSDTVVAISMDKKQKINNVKFKRLEKQNIGKRKFEIYKIQE